MAQMMASLQPLRSGAPPVSAEERARVYADWEKWRPEWIKRRKVFTTLWQLATDPLPPQDAKNLEDDLGIERDSPEHAALEKGPLCAQAINPLKRKR
ncbi:unnamed protein product [Cyclocybe aegerita]|uniref:Uncharacterized protein n=1 Tax=Cyclocybe aegerita TaxID=1973307 RepID=A0A8S0VWC0_CYCAE|nr:unnamed protein product [Cyclocybe aegerita]